MLRTTVSLTLFGFLLAVGACADPSAPPSTGLEAPRSAAQTRYILASGEVLPPGCRDLGNGLWLCDDSGSALQGASQPAAANRSGDNENENEN